MKLRANCDLVGYLRYGHYELELSDEEFVEFNILDEEEKKLRMREDGTFILDSYRVEFEDLYDVTIDNT